MTPVTDPALLAKLDATGPVTDPALLAKLNAAPEPVTDPELLARLNKRGPELRAGPEPSWRQRITDAIMSDGRTSPEWRRLAEGLPDVLSLIPPVGVVLAGDAAAREGAQGNFGKAALQATGVIPALKGMVPAMSRAAPAVESGVARVAEPVGNLKPISTPVDNAPLPDVAAKPIAAPTDIVTPDSSMSIAARPEIVELADLKAATGSMQPRDRARPEYAQEVRDRASRLDPAQLMPNRVSDAGAPIVLPDGTILSGNGRTMSIAEAYNNPALKQHADAYRAALGPEAAQMRQPVLVMRTGAVKPEDAARFADLSNRGRIAQMSVTERAARDANALGPDIMGMYQGGDFTAANNIPFLRAFSEKAVTAAERPAFSKGAELSQEGVQRMRAAVLHNAYEDAPTLSRMLESTDDNIRNLTGALTDAAPGFSGLKADIKAGSVMPDLDASRSVTDAVKLIGDLRSRGVSPQTFFAQKDAFSQTDPIVEAWVRAFYNDDLSKPVSRQKMTEVLNAYTTEARKHAPGGMFDDPTTTKDVLNVATRSAAQAGLF